MNKIIAILTQARTIEISTGTEENCRKLLSHLDKTIKENSNFGWDTEDGRMICLKQNCILGYVVFENLPEVKKPMDKLIEKLLKGEDSEDWKNA